MLKPEIRPGVKSKSWMRNFFVHHGSRKRADLNLNMPPKASRRHFEEDGWKEHQRNVSLIVGLWGDNGILGCVRGATRKAKPSFSLEFPEEHLFGASR